MRPGDPEVRDIFPLWDTSPQSVRGLPRASLRSASSLASPGRGWSCGSSRPEGRPGLERKGHICAPSPRRPRALLPPYTARVALLFLRPSPEIGGWSWQAGWQAPRSGPGRTAWGRRGHQDQGLPGDLAQGREPSGSVGGKLQGHVAAGVPSPVVRQEEHFTGAPGPSRAAERADVVRSGHSVPGAEHTAVVFSLRNSEDLGWQQPVSEQMGAGVGGEGQGLSGLPSGLLLAMPVPQSAAQLGLQDQSKPIWRRVSCVILGVGDPSLGPLPGRPFSSSARLFTGLLPGSSGARGSLGTDLTLDEAREGRVTGCKHWFLFGETGQSRARRSISVWFPLWPT